MLALKETQRKKERSHDKVNSRRPSSIVQYEHRAFADNPRDSCGYRTGHPRLMRKQRRIRRARVSDEHIYDTKRPTDDMAAPAAQAATRGLKQLASGNEWDAPHQPSNVVPVSREQAVACHLMCSPTDQQRSDRRQPRGSSQAVVYRWCDETLREISSISMTLGDQG